MRSDDVSSRWTPTGARQINLLDNPMLREPLRLEHIKHRCWGIGGLLTRCADHEQARRRNKTTKEARR
jgi:phosphoketolase